MHECWTCRLEEQQICVIDSTSRIASGYPPQCASVWSWEGSSSVRYLLLDCPFTSTLCFISKSMTAVSGSSTLSAWCGLSKEYFFFLFLKSLRWYTTLIEELITFLWKSSHKTLFVAANAIFPKLFFWLEAK